ncbi:hypothetical protein PROVRUST_08428, partial [Providencia rustigianii DSM 4541]
TNGQLPRKALQSTLLDRTEETRQSWKPKGLNKISLTITNSRNGNVLFGQPIRWRLVHP